MRIGMALVVLCDLFVRVGDLRAHYSDEGIWPTELIPNFGWNPGYWSIHVLHGSYLFGLLLFSVHLLAAFFLLIGFKTRLFSLLVWLFTISLHNRNLFVLQAGDDLLRLILLWGIFLPWGSHYSWDAKKGNPPSRQNIVATLGYLLLLASVYFFSANLKTSKDWYEGDAVYYALSLDQLRLPIGDLLYPYPTLLKALTWLVLGAEYLIAPLILFPSRTGRLRFAAFTTLLLLHLGIGLTLYVGLFFSIGIVSSIGLLPSRAMDRIDTPLSFTRPDRKLKPKRAALATRMNTAVCAVLIFLSMFVNLGTVSWFPYEMSNEVATGANALRLNQYWGMFSPGVMREDGWFVFHGIDSVGRQWDLKRNQDYVDYKKPKHIVSEYASDRWRKLAENMQTDKYTFLRPLYCKYTLHQWNKRHPEKKLLSLKINFMQKETLPDYKSTEPVKVLHCLCYDQ